MDQETGLLDLPTCVLVLLLRRLARTDLRACASLMSTCRSLASPLVEASVFQHVSMQLAGEHAAIWLQRELSLATPRPHARAYVELRRSVHVVSHLWRGVGDSTTFCFFFSSQTASLQCVQLRWDGGTLCGHRVARDASLEIIDCNRLALRFPTASTRSPSSTALAVAALLSASPVGSPLSSAVALSHAASTIATPRRRRRQPGPARDDIYLILWEGSNRLKRRLWDDAWKRRAEEPCELAWIPAPPYRDATQAA